MLGKCLNAIFINIRCAKLIRVRKKFMASSELNPCVNTVHGHLLTRFIIQVFNQVGPLRPNKTGGLAVWLQRAF